MYKYAQLDADGFLISVLTYSSPIEDSLYIEIEDDSVFKDFYKPKYENGQWIEGATPEEIEAIENPKEPEDPFERIAQLEAENVLLKAQNKALVDRTDFHEDVLEEIILTIYS